MTETACPSCQEFDVEDCPFHASLDDIPGLRAATDQARLIAADEQGC
jgi:hypothetical protein